MKVNIIIDGNYLMQKSVFILYKLRTLYKDLPTILEKDYNTLTNLYYFNKIYFISDSRTNWRKKYYENYKGTRKKNENINWDMVYDLFNDFKYSYLKNKNCQIYQIDNLEGDDIISFIVNKTNRNGYSNLIIGNDSDLFQLINYDAINKYINIMYNYKFNDERLFIPTTYERFMEEIKSDSVDDLFDSEKDDNEFVNFLENLIRSKKVTRIDCEKELFAKIVGHNKDNIKSIYLKGDRGIGKIGAEKIYDFYKETYPENIDFNSKQFKERLLNIIKLYKKIKNNQYDEIILNNLNMNLKLVKLDKRSIPDNLYERMEEIIELPE